MTKQTQLQFPCQFVVKALGKNQSDLADTVLQIVQTHSANASPPQTKPSKNGKYLSITITITATSQQQITAIYQDLATCPTVVMSL